MPGGHHGVDHDLLGIGVVTEDVVGDGLEQAPVLVEQTLDGVGTSGSQVVDQPLAQLTPAARSPIKRAPPPGTGR
jgi:hypothetical protein